MKKILILMTLLSALCFSDEIKGVEPSGEFEFQAGVAYSFLDTWLPSKIHVEAEAYFNDHGIVIDYGYSGMSFDFLVDDLGDFSEQRISLLYNYKQSGWMYGIELYKMNLSVGQELVSTLTSLPSSLDLIEVESLNFSWGYRSKYEISENLLFVADWFRVHIPIKRLKVKNDFSELSNDSSKIEEVEDILNKLSKVPTFSFLRVGLTYRF